MSKHYKRTRNQGKKVRGGVGIPVIMMTLQFMSKHYKRTKNQGRRERGGVCIPSITMPSQETREREKCDWHTFTYDAHAICKHYKRTG